MLKICLLSLVALTYGYHQPTCPSDAISVVDKPNEWKSTIYVNGCTLPGGSEDDLVYYILINFDTYDSFHYQLWRGENNYVDAWFSNNYGYYTIRARVCEADDDNNCIYVPEKKIHGSDFTRLLSSEELEGNIQQ